MSRYIEILVECFEADVSIYSQPWIYYWLFIPCALYTMFFFIKWFVLTAPIWLLCRMVLCQTPLYAIEKLLQAEQTEDSNAKD